MDLIIQSAFGEVAVLLVLAALIGFIGIILRQPLIVSFIAVGLVAGPSLLDVVRSDEQIHLLSELGIALLLFLVGIKLDVKLIRSLGAVSLTAGLGQAPSPRSSGSGSAWRWASIRSRASTSRWR